jgi:hypothetical protein
MTTDPIKTNPIVYRRYGLLTSARVILDDGLFLEMIKRPRHAYIVAISHQVLSVPDTIKIKHKKTINIYLEGKFDEIFMRFNDTARNEVRKTFKMPEFSVALNNANWGEVYALYKKFRIAKHLELRPVTFLQSCMLFNAYYNGELISSITCYDVFPNLRIQNIFSKLDGGDKELRKIVGHATRRLMYEICKYGNERGYRLLDLASANFTNPAKAGITAFKSSFGGKVEDEYTYTYRSPLVRVASGLCSFFKR